MCDKKKSSITCKCNQSEPTLNNEAFHSEQKSPRGWVDVRVCILCERNCDRDRRREKPEEQKHENMKRFPIDKYFYSSVIIMIILKIAIDVMCNNK